MRNLSLALILGSCIAGCSETAPPPPPEPPAPHIVSREDIIDFCDTVSSYARDDGDKQEAEDTQTAKLLGGTNDQAEKMVFGAAVARLAKAVSSFGRDDKSFEQECRGKVRKYLAKLESEK